MKAILKVLRTLSASKVLLFIQEQERVKLQNAVFFNILSIAALKSSQSLSEYSLVELVEIGSNLIRNCNCADSTIQNELVLSLIQFKQKVYQYEMKNENLKNTLHRVLSIDLLAVIAPKKQEKYLLPSNTLSHLHSHQVGLFVQQNRDIVK